MKGRGKVSQQVNFGEIFGRSVSAMGEPHLACVLLLDVSESMEGNPIASLNQAINQFKDQVCRDEIARKRVDIAIVSFATDVNVVCDFVPVEKMPVINLEAEGITMMAEGIDKAIDMVKERNALYEQIGIPFFKPWIFMITDGLPNSDDEEMQRVADRIYVEENAGSHGKLKFWVLGIEGYDSYEMFRLTKRVVELKDHDFTGIFDWLSESMASISQSTVGQKVTLERLPENARKARDDRAIDEDW